MSEELKQEPIYYCYDLVGPTGEKERIKLKIKDSWAQSIERSPTLLEQALIERAGTNSLDLLRSKGYKLLYIGLE